MTAVNGAALRAGLARLKLGTTWSAPKTSPCPGFATNNPNESTRIDTYVDQLAQGMSPVPPTMLTDTGNGVVAMLAAMIAGAAPSPPPPTGPVLFEDTFAGAAGSPPDPAKWVGMEGKGGEAGWGDWCPIKNANAFLNGTGQLVLRAKRESTPAPNGSMFSGAWIGTFLSGWGWPAAKILHAWTPPFKYEARWLMPNVKGAHVSAGWVQTCDKPTTEKSTEIDCGEARSTFPLECGFHQHTWLNGVDINNSPFGTTVSDWRFNWHTIGCEVRVDRVDMFLDGVKVKTQYAPSPGRLGVLLHNPIALPQYWGSGYQNPDPADPGPWDMLVDYVRVTGL